MTGPEQVTAEDIEALFLAKQPNEVVVLDAYGFAWIIAPGFVGLLLAMNWSNLRTTPAELVRTQGPLTLLSPR